jgi:POT family proton-dependent oligopeptide transporter
MIIIASPILTYGVYPFFERIGYPLKAMTRMTIGFFLAALGCMVGAIVQDRIYKTSPCGKFATNCPEGVSPVSLWLQLPIIILPAIGELFVNVTSYELAYTRSPPRMRGLVYSLSLFNTAIASAISMACSSALTDPNLLIAWIVLASVTFACCFVFPTVFRGLNNFEFEWSSEEKAVQIEGRRKHSIEEGVPEARDEDKY